MVPPISKTVSDFPVFIYNLLTYMGVSRTHLEKLPSGQFVARPTTGVPFLIYMAFHINSWCKGLFLVCLFAGIWNFEMEFFDYIAGLLWFLIFIEICIGDWLLMRRYPYFEILLAGLRLQNEIHEKLGPRAEEFRQKQNSSALKKVWFQWIIILMGIAACILQYASAPKYCIFTNALIEKDTPLINWIMGFHDVGFIVNAWMLYGSDIAVQSVFGQQFQHCLKFMAHEVRSLSLKLRKNSHVEFKQHDPLQMILADSDIITGHPIEPGVESNENISISSSLHRDLPKIPDLKVFHIPTVSKSANEGSRRYEIDDLIIDYRKLGIYAEQMNDCCSYNFLAIHIIAYIQMTCDVFVIFQLLRTPGSQPEDVAYFIEDCIVCMYLLFKCFKSISFVGVASDEFLEAVERYLEIPGPRRKYHQRIFKSLPKIVMRLGPSDCSPSTVGNACMILMNYYIMVALW